MKNKMKNVILKWKNILLAGCLYLTFPKNVYASEPALITGTRSLLSSGTLILTGLVSGVIVFNGLKVGMKWINATAEEKPKYQKELINVIISGVVTLTIGGTVTWILGYYQG